MDDFTKNMLERAKARRHKLNSQLSQAGRTPQPLQDASNVNRNTYTKSSPKHSKVSLSTTRASHVTYNVDDVKLTRQTAVDENDEACPAEKVCKIGDGSGKLSSSSKAKLQQLGHLYSGDGGPISSPVHKSVEHVQLPLSNKQNKCRLGRLNQLAETINQWDDDLRHPDIKKAAQRPTEQNSPAAITQPSAKITRTETKLVESTVTTVIHMATINKTDGEEKVNKTTATILGVKKNDGADAALDSVKNDLVKNVSAESIPDTRDAKSAKPVVNRATGKDIKSKKMSATDGGSTWLQNKTAPRLTAVTSRPDALDEAPNQYIAKQTQWDKAIKLTLESQGVKNAQEPKKTYQFGEKQNVSPRSKDGGEMTVAERKARFEGLRFKSPVKSKDPAELTLAERKALFEKNKGNVLVPKVAFATPLPANMRMRTPPKSTKEVCLKTNGSLNMVQLRNNRSPKKLTKPPLPALSAVGSIKSVFEKDLVEVTNVNLSKLEREKDLELLKNRWNKNKACEAGSCLSPPQPPPMPLSPTSSSPHCKTSPEPELEAAPAAAPARYRDSPDTLKAVQGVKAIVVSPPRQGSLYPNLSDIEASDASSSEQSSTNSSLNDSKSSNIYLNMSFGEILEASKHMPMTPPRTQESAVLNEMDQLLEDALGGVLTDEDNEGPTPPKQHCGLSNSDSFQYERTTPKKNRTPLLRTISSYRKEQNSPVAMGCNNYSGIDMNEPCRTRDEVEDESGAVAGKMLELKAEMDRQMTIITQASNALSVCINTFEFSGSDEHVEGEKLLLLAENKRKACEHEYQRLRIEGTLRSKDANTEQLNEQGDLVISNITLCLRREALRNMAAEESMLHFVCVVRSDEKLVGSEVVRAMGQHMHATTHTLTIPGQLRLQQLYPDFKATVEVYCMNLGRGLMLPHHVKYHLPGGKKDKKLLTPLKNKKNQSRLISGNMQSPAGPNTVRSSSFKLCGFTVFSLRDVKRTQWTLNKVTTQSKGADSPLEGSMGMQIACTLKMGSEHRGFLNMFDDVSGLGAWQRRWCLLTAHHLSYWKYPEHQHNQIPIGSIDLRTVVTEQVGPVSRVICARNNTLLLETTRPRQPHDTESLVLLLEGDVVRIRHLLCSDTKEEALEWAAHLNNTLALIRA